jgi:hypothetical protein
MLRGERRSSGSGKRWATCCGFGDEEVLLQQGGGSGSGQRLGEGPDGEEEGRREGRSDGGVWHSSGGRRSSGG